MQGGKTQRNGLGRRHQAGGMREGAFLMVNFIGVLILVATASVRMDNTEMGRNRRIHAANGDAVGIGHPASWQHRLHQKCDQRDMADGMAKPQHPEVVAELKGRVNFPNVARE